ncbi:MAG TPA: histidine kinase [Verrucomicrobiae bacterium]|nr:histidine kinase [Verrucomicrobiae bacterium]
MNIHYSPNIFRRLAGLLERRVASGLKHLIVFSLFAGCPAVLAQPTNELLTNAVDVISLPAEKASDSIKVFVTGVVTAADPALQGRFFVQDGTGGVFVDNANGRRPEPGEVVEVSGITYIGAYAPTITAPLVRQIGTAPLPPAKPVSVEELMSGAEDSQRIEIAGIVRDARLDGSRLVVDLVAGGFRFRAYVIVPVDFQPHKLIGSRVLIRGTAAEAHNRSLRQLITVEIYVPTLADLVVENAEGVNPFDKPVIPLNKLAQFRRDNSLAKRVHVRGAVTLQKPGEYVFLQDASGGLQIQNRQPGTFALGDVVEAVGFPSFENHLPVLEDATFRKTQAPPSPVKPRPSTIEEFPNGLRHAEYVSLTGKLIERTVKQGSRGKTAGSDTTTVLVLQGTNFTFTAEADDQSGRPALGAIPIGSVMEVNGVCVTEIDSDGKLRSFQILMQNPGDFRIIRRPSWFTPKRLLIGFSIVSVVLFLIVSWTVMLSRKNQVLNFLIRERENAQRELQQAHDQLEERVKERTAELKFQITARKESELQFKAVLSERTRLAQELHDTVEQTLTGLAWQLDAAFKLYAQNPGSMLKHLELARKLMSRSQTEVRQSVWDLRRLVQEHFDLSKALLENARQLAGSAGIHVDLKTKGRVRALPEIIEECFLRINHEALTNVIKHSGATSVKLQLEFEPEWVALIIEDNGRGFHPPTAAGPGEGHFGLLGISERVKRFGGRFNLTSAPNMGTTLQIEIPVVADRENAQPPLVNF